MPAQAPMMQMQVVGALHAVPLRVSIKLLYAPFPIKLG
jgi:hypothetical protein